VELFRLNLDEAVKYWWAMEFV